MHVQHRTDSSVPNKKRKTLSTLSLECKLHIIKDFDTKIQICEFAKKFHLLQTVVIDKKKILEAVNNAHFLNSIIVIISVNNCLVDQNTECSQINLKCERFKEDIGQIVRDEEFKACNGWFNLFKSRCNWHSIAESGEVATDDKEAPSYFPN